MRFAIKIDENFKFCYLHFFFLEQEQVNGVPQLVFAVKVDCSNMGLTELPKTLPMMTISLNISNNNVKYRMSNCLCKADRLFCNVENIKRFPLIF